MVVHLTTELSAWRRGIAKGEQEAERVKKYIQMEPNGIKTINWGDKPEKGRQRRGKKKEKK